MCCVAVYGCTMVRSIWTFWIPPDVSLTGRHVTFVLPFWTWSWLNSCSKNLSALICQCKRRLSRVEFHCWRGSVLLALRLAAIWGNRRWMVNTIYAGRSPPTLPYLHWTSIIASIVTAIASFTSISIGVYGISSALPWSKSDRPTYLSSSESYVYQSIFNICCTCFYAQCCEFTHHPISSHDREYQRLAMGGLIHACHGFR